VREYVEAMQARSKKGRKPILGQREFPLGYFADTLTPSSYMADG
jgi:hypothetical protein